MSSRFVPAGSESNPTVPDDAWSKAKEDVDAQRKPKPVEKQDGGKSLYEVLQQNKAAKQEAFEESIRLKNQFRALDEDEVDFLESVLESSRAKEDAVKRETADQLEAFRKQRAVAEQALSESPTPGVTGKADTTAGKGSWGMQKKRRRRDRDDEAAGGLKVRKLSSSAEDETGTTEATKPPTMGAAKSPEKRETTVPTASKTDSTDDGPKTGTAVLGLIGYESDSDD